MTQDVHMDFPHMEELINVFMVGAEEISESAAAMMRVIELIEGGALMNAMGDRIVEVMRGRVIPALNQGEENFNEIARDLMGALRDIRDGDSSARSRFSD